MIYFSDYSVFEMNVDCIVNTINCDGFMGKGLALEFAIRYPELEEKYITDCKNGIVLPNKLYDYRIDNRLIINFPTKFHFKDPSQIIWIKNGLDFFVENYHKYNIKSIAFPMLGTLNGGLDGKEVIDIMVDKLSKVDIDVYICKSKCAGPIEQKMIDAFNNSSLSKVAKEIKLNKNQVDSLKNGKNTIKRFYELKNFEKIGKETYKKLYFYYKNYNPLVCEQLSLF